MISEAQILEYIKQYSETKEGKEKIAKVTRGRPFVPEYTAWGDSISKEERAFMKSVGSDMVEILYDRISGVVKSFRIEDIIIGEPYKVGDQYGISISFNEEALRRESLVPDRYPDGVSNIIRLFVTGYHARNNVRGPWMTHGGIVVDSVKDREPNSFMSDAVNEFNMKFKDIARASLAEEYKTDI